MTTDPRALIAEWQRDLCESTDDYSKLVQRHATLLDGYASALDEVDFLKGCLHSRAEHARLRAGSYNREHADNVTLRTSAGELKLVIEQQDRDMEQLKKFEAAVAQGFLDLGAANQQINRLTCELTAARDMNRHYEQERDAWPAAYKQRAVQTDARIAELEAGPPGWICPTCKDPNCG